MPAVFGAYRAKGAGCVPCTRYVWRIRVLRGDRLHRSSRREACAQLYGASYRDEHACRGEPALRQRVPEAVFGIRDDAFGTHPALGARAEFYAAAAPPGARRSPCAPRTVCAVPRKTRAKPAARKRPGVYKRRLDAVPYGCRHLLCPCLRRGHNAARARGSYGFQRDIRRAANGKRHAAAYTRLRTGRKSGLYV